MSNFIWVEKYRPKTIEECILPEATKKTFQEFLNKGEIPNMLLAGPPGIGKTIVANLSLLSPFTFGTPLYDTRLRFFSFSEAANPLNPGGVYFMMENFMQS